MKKKWLLTSISGFPLIVNCKSEKEIRQWQNKVKNSIRLSQDTYERNKENFTDETDDPFLADMINRHFGEHEVYLKKDYND